MSRSFLGRATWCVIAPILQKVRSIFNGLICRGTPTSSCRTWRRMSALWVVEGENDDRILDDAARCGRHHATGGMEPAAGRAPAGSSLRRRRSSPVPDEGAE